MQTKQLSYEDKYAVQQWCSSVGPVLSTSLTTTHCKNLQFPSVSVFWLGSSPLVEEDLRRERTDSHPITRQTEEIE